MTVEYVKGEFYWRVEQGETVRAVDYVSAPSMLSQEVSENEINWSLGTYMTNAEVEKAFGIADLPKPWNVGPNQPFTGQFYYTWAALPILGLLLISIFMIPFSGTTATVHSETLTMTPAMGASPQIVFSKPFDIKASRNVKISASAPVSNQTVDLDVDLVNEQSQEVESVSIPVSYYQGVEGGESWTEGSPNNDATLSSLAGGRYTLRIEGTLENIAQPVPVSVKVEQNVSRGVNFICALVILLIVPIFGLVRKLTFETGRWKDSMFGSSSSESE